jgi:hypothetical protein
MALAAIALESKHQTFIRPFKKKLLVGLMVMASASAALAQEKVLRIAMTAADIPRTLGQPDQGFEGNRFTGIPMYDALTHWDLSKSDAASVLIPGLATSWSVNAQDKTKWTFKLRSGVKFHDGSPFNADAVVWNVGKVLDKDAPHFDPSQVGVTASRMPTLRSARKIDDLTTRLAIAEKASTEPIAVVGIGCRLPGGVNNAEEFWTLLQEGASGVIRVPADRWDADAYYSDDHTVPGTICNRNGGFLTSWQPDEFDAEFFNIAPREAAAIDPQQRLLLLGRCCTGRVGSTAAAAAAAAAVNSTTSTAAATNAAAA